MDKEYYELVLNTFVEYYDTPHLEFIRNNIFILKELSAVLYVEISDIDLKDEEYTEYYSFYDSTSLARDFIGYINPKYLESYDKFIVNGTFDIISEPESIEEEGYVDSEILDDGQIRNSIRIPLKHNLDDVYTIVHEFFHTTNIESFDTFDRDLLTESVSIFYEFILHDYLSDKNVNHIDNNNSINFRLNQILDDCYCVNYELDYIYDVFNDIDLNYGEKSQDEMDEYFEELFSDVKYFVSSLIAIVKYYEYKNGYINIGQIERFNESLKYSDNLNSLEFIFNRNISEEDIKASCDYIKQVLSKEFGMKK